MLRIPLRILANALRLLFWPLRWWRARRAAPAGAFVVVEVDGAVRELPSPAPRWARPRALVLDEARRALALAAVDPRVAGALFVLRAVPGGGATRFALRELVREARSHGLRTAAWLPHGGGSSALAIASAAEHVYVGSESELSPLGFATSTPYLAALFERVGIRPRVFARGRYKTAGEALVARAMSEAQAEQLGALLDDASDELIDALVTGRRVDAARARRFIDEGPYLAEEARSIGLCDDVCYPDELPLRLAPTLKEGAPLVRAAAYLRRRRLDWAPVLRPPYLAVVELVGTIVGRSQRPAPGTAEERSIVEALEQVRDDPRARGLVLHVDSRGGSALASDRMLRAVRRVAEKKPVVACFGDAAASGGYLAAMGAHEIVAAPTTITGSIGVVAVRFDVEPLLERLDVPVPTVKRGARADLHAPTRPLSEAEASRFEALLDAIYASFLGAVSQGRGRPVEAIEPLAGGRVWSGRRAAIHGLVDSLGGLPQALKRLRSRVGAGAEQLQARVVASPRSFPSPLALLTGRLGATSPWRQLAESWAGVDEIAIAELRLLGEASRRPIALAWAPGIATSTVGDGVLD